jgi:hypothetical protein
VCSWTDTRRCALPLAAQVPLIIAGMGVVLGSSTSVARGSVFLGVDWMLQVCRGEGDGGIGDTEEGWMEGRW